MAEGTVELRSGAWAWHTMEVRDAGTDEGLVETYFWFRLHDSETSRMSFSWSGAFPEVDASAMALQARHPRERELRTPDGTTWRFYELSRPDISLGVHDFGGTPYAVFFRASDGRHGTAEMSLPDVCLGDATDEELLEIVGRS